MLSSADRRAAIRPLVCIAFAWWVAVPPVAARAQTAPDLTALDAYFAAALDAWRVPGMAVAIVKDGQVVMAKGYGVRERGRPARVDDRTMFAIASNTKAFTAATLAMLVDEQRVSWDDAVRKHLPWFELRDPYVSGEIRVRDLLSHRSGLGTFSGDLVWYNTPYSRQEVVRRARYLRSSFPFRAQYGYSNVMFVAGGEVVAAAAGVPWEAFARQRIFEPLGMSDTVTSARDLAGRSNVATPHGPVGTGERAYAWQAWDSATAAGGIISSVRDMSRWLLLQLGRGTLDGRTYFSEGASVTMWTPHVSFPVGKESAARFPSTHFRGYGLGWDLRDYGGRLIVAHGGAYDGMYSRVALVPEERLGVVILTNAMTGIGDSLVWRAIDAYLGLPARDWSADGLERARKHAADTAARREADVRARRTDTRPSLELAGYAGKYGGDLYGDATVTVEDGRLVLRLLPNPDFVADLSHWQFDTFRLEWRKDFPWFGSGKAQFLMDNAGRIVEMKLDVPNEDFWFHELEFTKK